MGDLASPLDQQARSSWHPQHPAALNRQGRKRGTWEPAVSPAQRPAEQGGLGQEAQAAGQHEPLVLAASSLHNARLLTPGSPPGGLLETRAWAAVQRKVGGHRHRPRGGHRPGIGYTGRRPGLRATTRRTRQRSATLRPTAAQLPMDTQDDLACIAGSRGAQELAGRALREGWGLSLPGAHQNPAS